MKKVKLLIFALLMCAVMCFSVFAADDIVFNFEGEQSMTGWSTMNFRYNFDPGYFHGYAVETSANKSDGILFSPKIDIQAEDYRYVVVTMKFQLDTDWSRYGNVFFMNPNGGWDAQHVVIGPRYESITEYNFKEYVFDMTTCANWKGNIKQIRFDPFDCPGTVDIKQIRITNTLPEVKEEKPVETNPEEPKKQTGVFLKPNKYNNNFSDVFSTDWYAKEVAAAYELGLINGKSETSFDPKGGMTVAEAITIAARTNNAYGSADFEFIAADGEKWYTPYVNYAVEKGIIMADTFSDYDKAITRAEMALVFANVLPAKEYNYINSVTAIPDVEKTSSYFNSICKLYNAGIAMGNDAKGTFNPDSGIIRAEAAAIINRVALKENRLSKNIEQIVPTLDNDTFTMSSEPKFLMDDEKFNHTHAGGVGGGWDVIKTYSTPENEGRQSYVLIDNSAEDEAYFKRDFFAVKDGVLDFEFGAVMYGNNGVFLAFTDDKGTPALQILLDMGKFKVLSSDGKYVDTGLKYKQSATDFDLRMNLDKGTYDLAIDGVFAGTYKLLNSNPISSFRYGVTKEGYLTLTAEYAILTHNYLEVERFLNAPDNILPYGIKVINDGGKVEKVNINTNNANGGSAALKSNANGKTGISGTFEKASGNVVFETYILLPTELDGAKIAIKNGDTEVFSLSTKDGNFVAPDGKNVKYVTKNLWHIVRFEADTATGKALVKINGKDAGTYAFTNAADAVTGYEITYTPKVAATMYADDITAFVKLPYPDDYVPEPAIPNGDDYLVGLNVCSLWREGVHYGWEEISAYPEITPVLGYYDEGNPEVSDWEIKMMTEHGIDYQIFCWYPTGNITSPIQHTPMNEAIVDGYFNARYSDKMQFAIMWENSSVSNMTFQDFKDYTVPYWIEYFFKDDRYLKINNKPLLTIWQLDGKFADVSNKEAMDYIRQACKDAGFDGCEIMLYSSNTDASFKSNLDANGVDGILGYHWGTDGANADVQASKLTQYAALDYTIPTISVGFDYVGWGFSEKRNGLLDPKDYPTMTDIVKDALAKRQSSGAKYANMVNISTWNEYGEGTYVMPTQRFGFGYLDAIREAFTKGDTKHNDLELTQAQRQRINYLFDNNRQLLRPQTITQKAQDNKDDPFANATVVKRITFEDMSASDFSTFGCSEKTVENGILTIKPSGKDPAVFFNGHFEPAIPTSQANGVRIRAKVDGETSHIFNLFYKTSDGKDFAGDKVVSVAHNIGQWHDYCFDMRKQTNWKDSIVNLRIDPAEYQCDLAQIESIEFVKLPEIEETKPFTVDINGVEVKLVKPIDRTKGHLMMHIYPESGVLGRLMSIYSWNKTTKTLTVKNKNHTVSFAIGTDKATVDGKEITLYESTYMDDGLPVVPFDTLCESLGYAPVFHEDGQGLSIMLSKASDYEIIKNRVPEKFEFDIENDLENWSTQQSSVGVKDGAIVATATGGDPGVRSPELSINAEMYPYITIRMKWNRDNADRESVLSAIYFTTASYGLSESRRVNVDLPVSSNGEFVELKFDMGKHLQWNGTITGLRFDPFDATGTYEIDYIRFEMDPEKETLQKYIEEREKNLDDTVANGDAEITEFNPMYADNAKITIVERDDGEGNCYNIKSNGGKTWTYITQRIKFKPGATYIVEFDARMVGTNDGNKEEGLETSIFVNFMYGGDAKRDHNKSAGTLKLSSDGAWTHYTVEMPVSANCNNEKDEIGIYTNPCNDLGVDYQIDNLTIREK